MNASTQTRFTDDVLDLLAKFGRAHQRTGNRDGEMSLSNLVEELRYRGWKNLSTSGFGTTIQDSLQAAGFTIRQQKNGNAVRTYVGI